MNYVVAALLLVAKDATEASDLCLNGLRLSKQEVAFWMTVSLIRRKGMADLWKHKMPGFVHLFFRKKIMLRPFKFGL